MPATGLIKPYIHKNTAIRRPKFVADSSSVISIIMADFMVESICLSM